MPRFVKKIIIFVEINTVSFTEELSGGSALFRKGERISSFQTSFSRLSSLKDPDPRILGLEYFAVAAKFRICFSTGFIRRRTCSIGQLESLYITKQ